MSVEQGDNILSYGKILKDIQSFKRAGTYNGGDFNLLDTPSNKYFKIFFYFGSKKNDFTTSNAEVDKNDAYPIGGLLAPTWVPINKKLNILNDIYKRAKSINYDDAIDKTKNKLRQLREDYDKSDIREQTYIFDEINDAEQQLNALMRGKKNALEGGADYVYSVYRYYNSAYSYLMLNDEKERADKLKKFIELLSNINTHSPWYFSSVNGINEALDRKFVEEPKVDLSERKKITITCLPDAFDNRISTLLELYRDVTWSWTNKREVIPANLRKFDMAIYIFENPDMYWHTSESSYWKKLGDEWKDSLEGIIGGALKNGLFKDEEVHPVIGKSPYDNIKGYERYSSKTLSEKCKYDYLIPSYKMIEFHDCEFSYNSIKSGISEISNEHGTVPKYTIDITYGDCYEMSYNDVLMREIGDIIQTDTYISLQDNKELTSKSQIAIDSESSQQRAQLRRVMHPHEKGWMSKLGESLMSKLNKLGNNALKRAALGNLYSFSLTKLRDQISNAINSPTSVITTVNDYVKSGKQRHDYMVSQNGFGRDANGDITHNIHKSSFIPGLKNAKHAHDKFIDGYKTAWGMEDTTREPIEENRKERSEDFARTEDIQLPGHGNYSNVYDDNIFKPGRGTPDFGKPRPGDGPKLSELPKYKNPELRDNNIFDTEGSSNTEAVKIGAQKRETGDLKNSNIFANYTKNKILSKMGKNNLYK